MFVDKIYMNVFLYSLALGLLLIYLMGVDRRVVYIYPTPETYQDIQFQDYSNSCYQYKPVKTTCPINTTDIHNVPQMIM